MIGWILTALVILVVAFFVFRSILSAPERPDAVVESVAHVDILPPIIKDELAETEGSVYSKADEVMRLASRETGVVARKEAEQERHKLDETSFMKAISDKVEKVRKLSESEAE